jgi:signal transduction histidine kinase
VLEAKSRTIGLNSLGFLFVTLAAYLSAVVTMGYMLNRLTVPKATVIVILAIIYLVNGIYGYAWIRNAASFKLALVYFTLQISFATILIFLAQSPAIMIAMLPLAGQSVVILPRRLMLGVCVTMWLALVVPMLISAGPGAAAVLGMFFLAGIVFVVVITQLAVKEQRARAEVERLLAELKEANDKLREYADQVEEIATLTERNRLAREIHDSLGHYLTVVIVQIEAATAVMETDRDRSLDGLRKAQALAQKGLADVRRSITALRAPQTGSHSLVDSLNTLFEECRVSGVTTEFELLGTPRKLSPSAELTLYRAAQEGLTNVRKHSHAGAARVTLDYAGEMVRLVVRDEGVGSNLPEKGFGLLGVHERVEALRGEVRISTAANQGFTMEVGLPG